MTDSGRSRIDDVFERARAEGRAAFIPYLMCGDPAAEATPALVAAAVAGGADLVELGMPFSDPLADGPTIQRASDRARAGGMTSRGCLDVVQRIRSLGTEVPIVLMGYANPLLRYGMRAFCTDAAAAGVDGLILADLPLHEADELVESTSATGLALVFLVTPLTAPDRIRAAARAGSGFLYCVSTTGTTGARDEVADGVPDFLRRVRDHSADLPIAVGFGISTPDHVAAVAPHADGVVVGSALVELVDRAEEADRAADALSAAVKALRAACTARK